VGLNINTRLKVITGLAVISATLYSIAHATDQGFSVGLQLNAPIVVSESSPLTFPNAVVSGQNEVITTAPSSSIAAQFTATGEASALVTAGVVESQITMITGDGQSPDEQIIVDNFTRGGDMDVNGNATFSSAGQLNNLRVGASANIQAEDGPGNYSGSATFRMVYQ
jgi:hypothetical protein